MLSKLQNRSPLSSLGNNFAIELTGNSRRPREKEPTDPRKCLICQAPEEKGLNPATDHSLKNFIEKFQIRARHNDVNYSELFERVDLENLDPRCIRWHLHSCYAAFCNKINVSRLSASKVSMLPDGNAVCNEVAKPFKPDECLFCQVRKPHLPPPSTITEKKGNVRQDVLFITTKNCKIARRIEGRDPIGLLYHSSCYLQNMKKFRNGTERANEGNMEPESDHFGELTDILRRGLETGHSYTIEEINARFQQMVGSNYPAWRLKQRLQDYFGDDIILIPPQGRFKSTLLMLKDHAHAALADSGIGMDIDDQIEDDLPWVDSLEGNEMRERYNVSQKIRMDLKAATGITNLMDIGTVQAENILPESLTSILTLIICGESQPSEAKKRRILSIGQDVLFAMSGGKTLTPKHVGLAVTVHQKTRSKGCIQLLAKSGHCVGYDTLLRIETSLAKKEIERFTTNDNVYVPLGIEIGGNMIQFAVDNIDLNVESVDGKGSFHATNMSVFQEKKTCVEIEVPMVTMTRDKTLKDVPSGLTDVEPFFAKPAKKTVPIIAEEAESGRSVSLDDEYVEQESESEPSRAPTDKHVEKSSLQTTRWLCQQQTSSEKETWTDHNKRIANAETKNSTYTGYMPIINAVAHEFDTLNTVFTRCQKLSKKTGQTFSVITCDEQLYQKGMQLVWSNPEKYQGIILRMGGFHVALNYLKVIGKRFKNSGLSECWAESGLFGPNVAEKANDGGHYNRSTRGLKVTLQALWQLLSEVVAEESPEAQFPPDVDFETTEDLIPEVEKALLIVHNKLEQFDKEHSDGTSRLWRSYMKMAIRFLNFVKADRSGDWNLHISSFEDMIPDFAGYDSFNYLRWGTAYLQQMKALPQTAPEVYDAFMDGQFVVKSSDEAFNGISPDMALEHINKNCKGSGGFIGITNKESALQRWCLTVASINVIATKTLKMLGVENLENEESHPDKEHPFVGRLQRTLHEKKQVEELAEQLAQVHPFRQKETNPMNIASGDVATAAIANDFVMVRTIGEQKVVQFNECFEDKDSIASFHESIKKVKSKTFVDLYTNRSKPKKADETKENAKAFQKLFAKKTSTTQAMKNELTTYPCAIIDNLGNLKTPTNKSVLCACLTDNIEDLQELPLDGKSTMLVVDLMSMVNGINVATCKQFGDFSDLVFARVSAMAVETGSTRVDVVCDRYEVASVKGTTRTKRTSGIAPIRKVIKSRQTPFPLKWKAYMALGCNKSDLQNFLAGELLRLACGKQFELIVSGGFAESTKIESSIGRDVQYMSSNHEEADSRLIIHCKDAARVDFQRLVVESKDTDVMVLLLHAYHHLPETVLMSRGSASAPSYAPIHEYVKLHSKKTLENLPAFHAITGCDSTSQFRGHTKSYAWKVFLQHQELLDGFGTFSPSKRIMASAEKFVVAIYDSKFSEKDRSNSKTADDHRAHAINKLRSVQRLPPTSRNLRYHLLRANYQTLVWKQATVPMSVLPLPTACGWKVGEDGRFEPMYEKQA